MLLSALGPFPIACVSLVNVVQHCFSLRSRLGLGSLYRFPQSFAFGFTFHFVQASPSVSVFQSSVPSDFASLKNLSGLLSVPSSSPSWFASLTCANRLRLIHPDPQKSSSLLICVRGCVHQIICLLERHIIGGAELA